MESQFIKTNLINKRIDAYTPESLPKIIKPTNCKKPDLAIACLCSHIKALQQGIKDNKEWFVVMEDDVEIVFDIDYERLILEVDLEVDIIQMFTASPKQDELRNKYKNGELFTPWKHRMYGTCAYLISKNGANKIIDKFIKNDIYDFSEFNDKLVADVLIFKSVKTVTSTYPLFCNRNDIYKSTIHAGHNARHVNVMNMVKETLDKVPAPFFCNNKY